MSNKQSQLNGPGSTYNQRIKFILVCVTVATNNPFCERIVLRNPKSRSNDYSSILHTCINGTHQNTKRFVKKNFQMFVSDGSNAQELRVAVIHDKHIAKKLHKFYYGKFLAKFQNVLPACFCFDTITQDTHVIVHLSVND